MSITSLNISTTQNSTTATLSGFTSTAVITTNKKYRITTSESSASLPIGGAVFDTTGLTIPTSGTLSITLTNVVAANIGTTASSVQATIDEVTTFPLSFNLQAFGYTSLTVPVASESPTIVSSQLSGISVDQSKSNGSITSSSLSACQKFKFSDNYVRSDNTVPELTGFQIYVSSINALEGAEDTASVAYFIDYYDNDLHGWKNIVSGTKQSFVPSAQSKYQNDSSEDNWFTVTFKPVAIDPSLINSEFRLRFFCNSFVTKLYYQSPNPLNNGVALLSDGVSNFNPANASIAFRILSAIADERTDFLKNQVRSSVHVANPDNVTLANDGSHWMSKPNPSQFAVENLYFDVSKNNEAITVDSVLVDPITPNIHFNVYYSVDSTGPGTDDSSWDNLMWTLVPKRFQATKRQLHVFPEPIYAKYIKIEFSHLQPRHYAAGGFQKPVQYKKHPQWVFDFFIADYMSKRNKTYDPYIDGVVTVDYDVYDLAFNYYKGDIIQTSNGPEEIDDPNEDKSRLLGIITNKKDSNSMSLDATTMSQIKTIFDRFSSHPASSITTDNAVSKFATDLASSTLGMDVNGYKIMTAENYPFESVSVAEADTIPTSTFDKDDLLMEKNFPSMFFYVTCRHGYREALAKFENDKAFFAGIKEVVFQREDHSSLYDKKLYTYGIGEGSLNVEHNDFTLVDGSWSAQ